jgi:hypothetical protein
MENKFSLKKSIDLRTNSNTLIFVITLLLIFIMAARTPVDTDMWWHLRIGEESLLAGHPILNDLFSYTKFGAVWTNHQWISEIGMDLLFKHGGFLALGGVVAMLATISFGFVFYQMQGPALIKAFVLILAAIVAAPVWVPRPELVSVVLLSIVGYILYLYKWKHINRLWLLVPLFILWGNVHGGYILGLGLIGAMGIGEILNRVLGYEGDEVLPMKKIIQLAFWTILAILSILLNPNGIRMWLIPFETIRIDALQSYIQEWASPDFHQLYQQPFIWMIFAIIASLGFSRRHLDGTDFVSLAIFGYLALVARRNFGPFAIVAAPILGRYSWSALQEWLPRIQPEIRLFQSKLPIFILSRLQGTGEVKPIRIRLVNFGIIFFLIVAGITKLYLVTTPSMINQAFENQNIPTEAIAWIEENQPEGKLFNSYNWGGYLIWGLRDYPVFVDGRTDLFADGILTQYLTVVNADNGWQSILNEWRINLILIEPNQTIAKILPYQGWQVLYQDDHSILFGRKD